MFDCFTGFQSRGEDYGGYTVKETEHTEVLWDLNPAENEVGVYSSWRAWKLQISGSSDYFNQNETVPFSSAQWTVTHFIFEQWKLVFTVLYTIRKSWQKHYNTFALVFLLYVFVIGEIVWIHASPPPEVGRVRCTTCSFYPASVLLEIMHTSVFVLSSVTKSTCPSAIVCLFVVSLLPSVPLFAQVSIENF